MEDLLELGNDDGNFTKLFPETTGVVKQIPEKFLLDSPITDV